MATHSSILAWEIPWTEEPGRLWGCKRGRHDLGTKQQHNCPRRLCVPIGTFINSSHNWPSINFMQKPVFGEQLR